MELSESQKRTVETFDNWYRDKNSLSFTLSGVAGTGKTFLTNYLIKHIIKNKSIVGVSAYTHKAVNVISNHTGVSGLTLHSLHGLRPSYDLNSFDLNKIQFEEINDSKFNRYQIIFIDEASMISKDLAKLNKLKASQFNTKLVMIGDPLQLLPVKENTLSNVFTDVDVVSELTDIVRQDEGNALLDLFPIVQGDVRDGTGNILTFLSRNKINLTNNKGYAALSPKDFKHIVMEKFKGDHFKKDVNNVRVAAFTNKRIIGWNHLIRTIVMEGNIKDIVAKGDVLMSYKTVVDEFNQPIIVNAIEYRVVHANKIMTEDKFAGYETTIKNLVDGDISNVFIVDHSSATFNNFYVKLLNLYRNAIYSKAVERGKKWREYFLYKDSHLTMIDFELSIRDTSISTWVKKEVDYGYAVTVHKLQGTTLNDILLDTMDIVYYNGKKESARKNTKYNTNAIDTRNRLIYTGLSRASKRAIFLWY